ncbi:MAG: hypothetical protein ACOC1K_07875 [Nanoarchaeota archaeon]
MKYLCIANKGLIEVEALTLVGASTKRDSETIGMFGSGNKYALAYLLRNNYNIRLFSGEEEIKVKTKPHSFREQNFNVIYINDEKTSITTEMGHKWSLWQALREIYANAIDEGLLFFDFVNEINPSQENSTLFYIEADAAIEEFMFNIQDYFAINKEVIFENNKGKIYKKHGNKTCVYRKGTRCFETNNPSLFDYDLYNIEINEDRMAIHHWEVIEDIWYMLSNSDKNIIPYEILNNIHKEDYLEANIDHFLINLYKDFSDSWKYVLKDKKICPKNMARWLDKKERLQTYLVPEKLYNKLSALTENSSVPNKFKLIGTVAYKDIEELSEERANILSKVYDFFVDSNFNLQYKCKVVNFMNKKVAGTIDKDNQIILLSDTIFEKGLHFIINTIIEEYIHLKYDVEDETREFQTNLIDEFVSYMKNVNNISL